MGPVLAKTCKGLHRASIGIRLQRASEGQYRHTPTKGTRGLLLDLSSKGFGGPVLAHLHRASEGQYWHMPTKDFIGTVLAYAYLLLTT